MSIYELVQRGQFQIKSGATAPSIRYQIAGVGDITSASAWFYARDRATGATLVSAPAVIVDGPSGLVQYDWAPGDLAQGGIIDAEFGVTFADGRTLRAPEHGYIELLVDRAISATGAATVPGQMGAPALVAVSSASIAVTLAADPATGGSAITAHDLRWSADGGVSWTVQSGVTSPVTLSGLSPATTYQVQTRAENAVGAGGWSASASVATPANVTAPAQMGAPGLAVQSSNAMVVTLAADPATGGSPITARDLRLSADGGTTWTVQPGVTSPVTLTGLSAATTYQVQTRAANAVGPGAWSASASATTSAAATAPAQMAAPALSGITTSAITVTLAADPANGGSAITGRDLRFSADGGVTWTVQSGVTSPVGLTGLAAATAYQVQTRAVNAVGAGAWSAAASASTAAAATAPAQMGAPALSAITSSGMVVTLAADPANGGSAITSRDLRYSADGGVSWTVQAGVTSPVTLSGLSAATTYQVQTRAANAIGAGAWSASTSATTAAAATAPAQMGAPALSGVTSSGMVVTLAADPANGGAAITSRDLRYSADGGTSWTTQAGVTSPVTLSGLSPSTAYQVQTRAVNAVGAGAWSASASATTSAATTAPAQMAAPTLSAVTASGMVATLAADPATGGSPITSRDLRYSADGGTSWTVQAGVTSPVTLSGLGAGTAYQVQTRAVNAIGAGAWSASASATTTSAATIAVAAFTADRIIYDSRAAFAANSASVPLSGTGTDGMVVQARALSVDDAGATSTAWVDVSTIAGGVWSGAISVPRSSSWYKPEVRIKTQTGVTAQGTNRFGVGHVIAMWGQSEIAYIAWPAYSGAASVTVPDPEAVQMYYFPQTFNAGDGAAGIARAFITTAAPVTAQMSALAAQLVAARPGEKFSIVLHAIPGTDFRGLVDNANVGRKWTDDLALHNAATSDGRKVGLASMSWFASPGSLGTAYTEALFPLIAKKTLGGAAVTIPGTITYTGGGSYQADHWFGELYDYAFTKWVAHGPHRFDITQTERDALHDVGGAAYIGAQNKQACRDGWRALMSNANATMFAPMGYSVMAYQNGRDDGAGSWTDITHPAAATVDGASLHARHHMLTVLSAAGLTAWTAPKFDNCLWDASGAWVEVWSSAGAITTTRKKRGLAALPATYPHWTEVVGFEVNGSPVTSAVIQGSGRVRITKPGGGNFISSDALTFGSGNGTGEIQFPQDLQNGLWMNYPIVDLSVAGVDGIPVEPLPAASVLANTLPAVTSFTTQSGQLTRFKDLVNWPTTGGLITIALDLSVAALGTTTYLYEMDNGHISLQVVPDGRLFLSIKDSANAVALSSVVIGSVAAATRFDVVVAVDLAALTAWTTLNGTTTARTLAANSGNLSSAARKLCLLARSGGTTNNVIGTIYKAEVWQDCVTGGGRPAVDTNLRTNGRIVGPASAANAHPWKAGGAVV